MKECSDATDAALKRPWGAVGPSGDRPLGVTLDHQSQHVPVRRALCIQGRSRAWRFRRRPGQTDSTWRLGCRTDVCGLFEEAARVVIEIGFLVDEAPEGGVTARAVGESIFTEADSIDELRVNVRSAVDCHFDDGQVPKVIRLHIVRNS